MLHGERYRIFICWILLAPALFALDPAKHITQYDMRIYTARDGLPMNSLKSVFQDSRGFIWVGLQEGLARFDGVEFNLYDKKEYPGLVSNFIMDIEEDSNGHLWVATAGGGIACFDGKSFHSYTMEDGLTHNSCFKIFVDKTSDDIWIGTEDGLCLLRNDTFYDVIKNPPNAIVGHFRSIYPASDGSLFVGGQFSGFYIIKPDTIEKIATNYAVWSFLEQDNGSMIIGSQIPYVLGFEDDKPEFFLPKLREYTQDRTILDMVKDRDGALWFTTDGAGIIRYVNGQFSKLSPENSLPTEGNFVTALCEDREGNLWFAAECGLVKLQDNKFVAFGRPEGLPSEYGHTVCEDNDGNICIGLRDCGLSILNPFTLDNIVLNHQNGLPPPVFEVTCVYPAYTSALWIGINMSGKVPLLKKGELYQPFRLSEPRVVRALMVTPQDEVYVGATGFISRYANDVYEEFHFASYNQRSEVTSLLKDEHGTLWFGTFGQGLYKLEDEQFTQDGICETLRTDGVNALYQDEKKVIWIGSDNYGLFRYHNGSFTHYSVKDGLFCDRIFSILEDDSLNLWCSGNRGVFSVSKQQLQDFDAGTIDRLKCTHYNHLDGMRETECNGRRQPSAWKSRDGRLWFSSMAGVACVDPNNLHKNDSPPPVYIESLTCNNDTTFAVMDSTIRLDKTYRNIEIKYTAPSFVVPERVTFSYMLEGYDKEWQDAGTRRRAFYTNLPHGSYTLYAQARNNDGILSSEPAELMFVIPPYWYETQAAFVGYVLLSLSMILFIGRWRYKRTLEKSKFQMQKEHMARLEALDRTKSRFFANITHEFRTPLTLIISPLEQLISKKSVSDARSFYKMMYANANRLLTLINQLLDLSKLESGEMKLKAECRNIVADAKTITMSFLSLAERKHIHLDFSAEAEEIIGYIDRDKFEKILNNLLSNAFKFSPKGAEIRVRVGTHATFESRRNIKSNSAESVYIHVIDTGSGIAPEKVAFIFDRFFQSDDSSSRHHEGTGIGLALVKEMVDLHRGDITVNSSPGTGSEFVVRLPLGKTHLRDEEIINDRYDQKDATEASFELAKDVELASSKTLERDERDPSSHPIVLLVEDNVDLRHYIREHLVHHFKVIMAEDGREGLEKAAEHMPDLIVSDVMMPEMDGFQLCHHLKTDEKTSHIPVILLTALADQENKIEGLQVRADDYIIKPFDVRELMTRTNNLIELRKQLRARFSKVYLDPKDIAITRYDEQFLQKLAAITEEHLSEEGLSINTLAQKLGWSQRQVFRKIKSLTGLTPQKFIFDFRIKRARQIILESDRTISEISYQTGFSSPAHLAKLFRAYYGVSPTESRNQNR